VVCDTLTARSGRCSLSAATSDVFPVPDAAATTNKKASMELEAVVMSERIL
jgi:hypothetical protein